MGKTRKSFLKRFKISKKGKILRRISGQSHFFSKKNSLILRRKKKIKKGSKILLGYKNY